MKNITLICCIILNSNILSAQTDQAQALLLEVEAIEYMEKGLFDKSIELLGEARKLDPDNYVYPYEQALTYFLKSDFSKTIHILEKLKKHHDTEDRLYQLLGNAYFLNGNEKKSLKTYQAGLKRFPQSGLLYFETGLLDYAKEQYEEALVWFEKGIEVDPLFPSNYFVASTIFFASNEEVWGMIYGEIFMNLERSSKRTEVMSQLLYDTYMNEISITGDSIYSVSFSESAFVKIKNMHDLFDNRLPFGIMVYEPTLLLAMHSIEELNIHTLNTIRSNFIDIYYEKEHDRSYPNLLFDYQKKIKETGHMEAYNYWVLMEGDKKTFEEWYMQHQEQWEEFTRWFTENPIRITPENKFYRDRY